MLVLFLILGGKLSGFKTISIMLAMVFKIYILYQVRKFFSIPNLWSVLIMKGCWILSNVCFLISWDCLNFLYLLEPPVYCSTEVVRMVILVLFLILREKLSVSLISMGYICSQPHHQKTTRCKYFTILFKVCLCSQTLYHFKNYIGWITKIAV